MNKLFDLLNTLRKKHREIEEKVLSNKNMILELADEIKKVYKDYIYIISLEELPLKRFEFKTNDEDIGFCGKLELEIKTKEFLIHRICFQPQHTISFCKDDIFFDNYILFESSLKSLSKDEIVKIIKTLGYMLENKQIIFKNLEEYISKTLNDKITKCSEEINTMENNLYFIENIKNNL